jgi:uncharacterized membrane protein YfcA
MPVVLVVTALIVGIAAAVQAISGFGFALLAVPLLTLVLPTREAVIVSTLTSLLLTVGASVRERAHADWPTVRTVMITALVGMPIGLVLLDALPNRALTALVGVSVLGSTALVWRRPALPNTTPVRVAIGTLTGVLTTATSTNGPPLVAAFQNMGYAPPRFRATLISVFAGCGFASLGFFLYGGDITGPALGASIAGVPAIVAGWLLGDRVFRRIDAARFRIVVLVALSVASAVTLLRAAW